MLVRTQVLFKDEQKKLAEELAFLQGVSLSELHRRIFDDGVKIQKKAFSGKVKKSQYEGWHKWIKNTVKGPSDSEYDKYAYNL